MSVRSALARLVKVFFPEGLASCLLYLESTAACICWLGAVHLILASGFEPIPMLRFVSLRMAIVAPLLWLCLRVLQKRGESTKTVFLLLSLLWLSGTAYIPFLSSGIPGFSAFVRIVLPWLVFGYTLFKAVHPIIQKLFFAFSNSRHIRLWLYLIAVAFYLFVGFRIYLTIGDGRLKGGDSAHYVLIAKSIAEDGDLDLMNNYRDITRPGTNLENFRFFVNNQISYFSPPGKIYSTHPYGLPFLLAPAYAIGGEPALLLLFVLMTALSAPLLFEILGRYCTHREPRVLLVFLFTLLYPFCVYGSTIWPESVTSVFFLFSFWVATARRKFPLWLWLIAGIALGYSFWLLPRRGLPTLVILLAGLLYRCFREKKFTNAIAVLIPCILLIAGSVQINANLFTGPLMTTTGRVERLATDSASPTIYNGRESPSATKAKVLSIKSYLPALAILGDRFKGMIWHNPFLVFLIPATIMAFFTRNKRELFFPLCCFWSGYVPASTAFLCGWEAGACLYPRYIMQVLVFLSIPCIVIWKRKVQIAEGTEETENDKKTWFPVSAGAGFLVLLSILPSVIALWKIGRFYNPLKATIRACHAFADISTFCFPAFRQQVFVSTPGFEYPPFEYLVELALLLLLSYFFFIRKETARRSNAFLSVCLLIAAVFIMDLVVTHNLAFTYSP
ncbi:MAG: hypothetical protein ACI4QT_06485 [Kiritimatiellia bacterium]